MHQYTKANSFYVRIYLAIKLILIELKDQNQQWIYSTKYCLYIQSLT